MLRLLGRGLVTVPREGSPGRDPMVIVSEDSKGRDLLLFPERDPRVIVSKEGSQGRDVISIYLSSTTVVYASSMYLLSTKGMMDQSRSSPGGVQELLGNQNSYPLYNSL